MNDWIPCSERMPEIGQEVLAFYPRWFDPGIKGFSGCCVASFDGLVWDVHGEFNPGQKDITHWQPLPAVPKEGELNDK